MVTALFTAPGAEPQGNEENYTADKPCLMVSVVTGSPSWVVVLQGSPDGINWTTMQTHDSSTNASGETVFTGSERYPSMWRRLYCVSCLGGQILAKGWAT